MIESRSKETEYLATRRSCLKISGQKGTLHLLEKSVKDNRDGSKDARASKDFMVARTFSGWASAEPAPHMLMIIVFENPTFSTEG